jgi:hypothetical protein
MSISPIPNLTPLEQYIWKMQREINLFPDVNFHETQTAQWHHVGPFILNFTQISYEI